jgi:hypothetical protein
VEKQGSEPGDWIPVYRSKVLWGTYQPKWESFQFKLRELCNGDPKCPLRITAMNYHNRDSFAEYGGVQTTFEELQRHFKQSRPLQLLTPRGRKAGELRLATLLHK